jgi:hypothetical protein
MYGAGWNTDDIAQGIENLSIIKLPPYSPEFNPVEQVWSWLRQHHLANRCVNGYGDIVDACSKAWNSFIDDIKRVTQMSSRDWLDVAKNLIRNGIKLESTNGFNLLITVIHAVFRKLCFGAWIASIKQSK